jgi:MFS family permease
MASHPAEKSLSPWSPLRQPVFRALWIAAATSNIGTLMQNVGAAWLMTMLAASPLMVALVQTATSLPVFLLALPAGALADVVDRRRLLLLTQGWMLAAAAVLGVLTLLGATTPPVLLALTFILGLGAAMNAPAWQAIVPELVPRPELPAAVALNSVGFNLARAVGPALGGIVIAATGTGVVFLLNAASFLGVIVVLFYWERPLLKSVLPAERMLGAIQTGARYVRNVPVLRTVLLRAGAFAFFGSALLALLPLFARNELGLSSTGYGGLLGAFGVGAILGAAGLPRIRKRISIDLLAKGGTLVFAAAVIAVANLRNFGLVCGVMIAGGVAWLTLLSTFNTSIQVSVPSWVRGRALAFYLLVFFGSMAGGGALWGTVAEFVGIPFTLVGTAVGLIAGLFVTGRYPLIPQEELDVTPSMHWPEHNMMIQLQPEDGPVLVTVEYLIDPERAHDFKAAMRALGRVRRRDGAMRWGLFHDTANPGRFFETFIVESWAAHLRQHERVTMADREVENQARSFQTGGKPPFVSHLIYAYGTDLND